MRAVLAFAIAVASTATAASVAAQTPVGNEMTGVSMDCDAITYTGSLAPDVSAALTPIHSLDGIAAVLKRSNVTFQRSRGRLSFDAIPTPLYASISKLPQGEPFIIPNPQGGTICVPIPSADSY